MALGFVGRWEKWRKLRPFFAELMMTFGVLVLAVDLAIFANQELARVGGATVSLTPHEIAALILPGIKRRLAPLLDALSDHKDRVCLIVTLDSNEFLCKGRLRVVEKRRESLWKTVMRAIVRFVRWGVAGRKGAGMCLIPALSNEIVKAISGDLASRGFRSVISHSTSEADCCLAAQAQLAMDKEEEHNPVAIIASSANDFLALNVFRYRVRHADAVGYAGVTDLMEAAQPLHASHPTQDGRRALWGSLFFDTLAPPADLRPESFGFFRAAKVIKGLATVRKPRTSDEATATALSYVRAIRTRHKSAISEENVQPLVEHVAASFISLSYPVDLDIIDSPESIAAAYNRIYKLPMKSATDLAKVVFPLLHTQPATASAKLFPHISHDSTLVKSLLEMQTGHERVHTELSPLERAACKAQRVQAEKRDRPGPALALTRLARAKEAIITLHQNARPMIVDLCIVEPSTAEPVEDSDEVGEKQPTTTTKKKKKKSTVGKTDGEETKDEKLTARPSKKSAKDSDERMEKAAAIATRPRTIPRDLAEKNALAAGTLLQRIQSGSAHTEYSSVTLALHAVVHEPVFPFLLDICEAFGKMCTTATEQLTQASWDSLRRYLDGKGDIVVEPFTENSIREFLRRGRQGGPLESMNSEGTQGTCRRIFTAAQENAAALVSRRLKAHLQDSIEGDDVLSEICGSAHFAPVRRIANLLLTPLRRRAEDEDEHDHIIVSMDSLRAAFLQAFATSVAHNDATMLDLWQRYRSHFLAAFASARFTRYFPTTADSLTDGDDIRAVAEMAASLIALPRQQYFGNIGARVRQAAAVPEERKTQTRGRVAAKEKEEAAAKAPSEARKIQMLLTSLQSAETLQGIVKGRPELAMALAEHDEPIPAVLPRLQPTHPLILDATTLAHVLAVGFRAYCSEDEQAGDPLLQETAVQTELDGSDNPDNAAASANPSAEPMDTTTMPLVASASTPAKRSTLSRWLTPPKPRAAGTQAVGAVGRNDNYLRGWGAPSDDAVRSHFNQLADALEWEQLGLSGICKMVKADSFLTAVGGLLNLSALPHQGKFLQSFEVRTNEMEVRIVCNNHSLHAAQRRGHGEPAQKRAAAGPGQHRVPAEHQVPGLYKEDKLGLFLDKDLRPGTVVFAMDPGSAQIFGTACLAKDLVEDIDGTVTASTLYLAQRLSSGWYYDKSRADQRARNREQAATATTWAELRAIDSHSALLAEAKARARGDQAFSVDNPPSEQNLRDFHGLLGRKSAVHRNGAFQAMLTRVFHKAVALYLSVYDDDDDLAKFNLVFLAGDGSFNTSRGGRRFPFAAFKSFLARFFPVISIGEYMTSQTCVRGHKVGKATKTTVGANKRRSNCYFIRCRACEDAGHKAGFCHPNGHDKDRMATFNFFRKAVCLATFFKMPVSLLQK